MQNFICHRWWQNHSEVFKKAQKKNIYPPLDGYSLCTKLPSSCLLAIMGLGTEKNLSLKELYSHKQELWSWGRNEWVRFSGPCDTRGQAKWSWWSLWPFKSMNLWSVNGNQIVCKIRQCLFSFGLHSGICIWYFMLENTEVNIIFCRCEGITHSHRKLFASQSVSHKPF